MAILEWEAPPTFYKTIGSGHKLAVLSRGADFLTGRADGLRSLFAGTYQDKVPAGVSDMEGITIWRGKIRHTKDTLRWVVWVKGRQTKMVIRYDDTVIVNIEYFDEHSTWTKETGTVTLSDTLTLTVGDWYDVVVRTMESNGGATTNAIHIAMLREEEGIQGWQTAPTFTATEADLDTKLNVLRDDLKALKDVADNPDPALAGIKDDSIENEWENLHYGEDGGRCECKNYHIYKGIQGKGCEDTGCPHCPGNPNGVKAYPDCYFGAGCQHPGTDKVYLACSVKVNEANVRMRIFYTNENGDWDETAAPTGHLVADESWSEAGRKDLTIDVTDQASQGDYCRILIQTRGTSITIGDETINPYLIIHYLGVYADETLTALKYWEEGDSLDHAQLNAISSRLTDLNTDGKLSTWRNHALRRVGGPGYRVLLMRDRGYPYLHYWISPATALSTGEPPKIKYVPTMRYNLEAGSWGVYLPDEEEGYHCLDLREIERMLPSMIFNLDDVDVAQCWVDRKEY